jgi:hypothetical protein
MLSIVLASLACLDVVSSVGEGSRLVEAMSESLSHEGAQPYVVGADATMDVEDEFPPVFCSDTPQEHLRGALAIELSTEDSVALGSQSLGVSNVIGEAPSLEEVEEGCPQVF